MNACRIFLAVLAKVFPVAWSGAHIDPVLATMCDELEKIMQKGCHHSWVNTMKLVIMDIPGRCYCQHQLDTLGTMAIHRFRWGEVEVMNLVTAVVHLLNAVLPLATAWSQLKNGRPSVTGWPHWTICGSPGDEIGQPGSTFIKPDQLDPWIKDQLGNSLLSTILSLQLPNFVSCGRACPSHMTQNLVTVGTKLWTGDWLSVNPWSTDQSDLVWWKWDLG